MRHLWEKSLRKWFVLPSSGVHFDMADGLRGVAILLVVISHGIYSNPAGPKIFIELAAVTGQGWMGVPIFFVLSGFLISLPFFRERAKDSRFWYPRGYATRRVLKIIPPFYLCIVILLVVYYSNSGDAEFFKVAAAWATGIAHFVNITRYFNTSFWSLWVEIGFYATLPLLFFLGRGLGFRSFCWFLIGCLIIVPLVSRSLTLPTGVDIYRLSFVERRYPNYLDPFAWGILFSALYVQLSQNPEKSRRYARLGYVGVVLLLLITGLYAVSAANRLPGQTLGRAELEMMHVFPPIATFLILFLVFDPASFGARLLSLPVLRFLGLVSYEWFLLHQPAQMLFRHYTGGSHGSMLKFFLIFLTPTLFTLALAIFIYHNFSLPIMRRGRDRVRAIAIKAQAGQLKAGSEVS